MPDLPADPKLVDRAFLSQEILPHIADMFQAPAVLTAPLPAIHKLDASAWVSFMGKFGETDLDGVQGTYGMFINSLSPRPVGVDTGLYVSAAGWNIYTMLHELVHWADFEVINRKVQTDYTINCHEAMAYTVQMAFYAKFPNYANPKPVMRDIPNIAEGLKARVAQEVSACARNTAIAKLFSRNDDGGSVMPNFGLQVYEVCAKYGRRAIEHDSIADISTARFTAVMAFAGKVGFSAYEGEVTYEVEETRTRTILYRTTLSAKGA